MSVRSIVVFACLAWACASAQPTGKQIVVEVKDAAMGWTWTLITTRSVVELYQCR